MIPCPSDAEARQLHFATIAAFVSGLGEDVTKLFAQVILPCDLRGPVAGQKGLRS